MKNLILVLNSGSTSIKYTLFDEKLVEIDSGEEKDIGTKKGAKNHREALERTFKKLSTLGKVSTPKDIKAVGHRVVHGGARLKKPIIVNQSVIKEIEKYKKLAPLHNPPNVAGIKACKKLIPWAKNVAVFDTGFFESLKPEAYLYAIPYQIYQKEKIRRYGFHGISHKYISEEAERILGKKIKNLITCHLGGGSSITATKNGAPIDTSMGLTPLEGLVMTTRSGSIDPSIPLFLISNLGYSAEKVDYILNNKSGFIGVCGTKNFKEILERKDEKAKLAYQLFLRSVLKYIGGYVTLLGGLDVLVFTAGIGENAIRFRSDVIKSLKYLGAEIDEKKNQKNEIIISTKKSKVVIMVIKTNEELMIAKETLKLVKKFI